MPEDALRAMPTQILDLCLKHEVTLAILHVRDPQPPAATPATPRLDPESTTVLSLSTQKRIVFIQAITIAIEFQDLNFDLISWSWGLLELNGYRYVLDEYDSLLRHWVDKDNTVVATIWGSTPERSMRMHACVRAYVTFRISKQSALCAA
jgi:hypothetical protein